MEAITGLAINIANDFNVNDVDHLILGLLAVGAVFGVIYLVKSIFKYSFWLAFIAAGAGMALATIEYVTQILQ